MKYESIPFSIPEEHFPVLSQRIGKNIEVLERLIEQIQAQGEEVTKTNLHMAAALLESDLGTSLYAN